MNKAFDDFAGKYIAELTELKSKCDSSDDFSVQIANSMKIVAIEKTIEILEDYHEWVSD